MRAMAPVKWAWGASFHERVAFLATILQRADSRMWYYGFLWLFGGGDKPIINSVVAGEARGN